MAVTVSVLLECYLGAWTHRSQFVESE